MSAETNNLNELRDEIDIIDESLHDLIMRRAHVVTRIKEAKQNSGGAIFWPGREAEVLRRLIKRHHGNFPHGAIVRVWRELISTFVSMQGDFKVAVWVGEDPKYWDIARDHFGSQMLFTSHATPCSVLQAVADGAASAGIVPLPQVDEDPWWPLLGCENDGRQVRICGRLPFLKGGGMRGGQGEALLVADLAPVETGEDGSYLIVESCNPISRSRLTELLTSGGFSPITLISMSNTINMATRETFLIEVEGFVGVKDRRLGKFLDDNTEFDIVRAVGAYPKPLDPES
tara:strand:- start:60 stop:920 length:861 start_codon:yes stop_codon:yes gene_type:complete